VRTVRRAAAALGVLFAVALLLGQAGPTPTREGSLPTLGTELGELPAGAMKPLADQACLHCHSADMIRQQKLNEKQWTAEITKMVGWGAAVPEDQRAALVAYLLEHFGPDNDQFHPVAAAPLRP
jgi:mono/diheme cytochrome c family protein